MYEQGRLWHSWKDQPPSNWRIAGSIPSLNRSPGGQDNTCVVAPSQLTKGANKVWKKSNVNRSVVKKRIVSCLEKTSEGGQIFYSTVNVCCFISKSLTLRLLNQP